MGLRVSVGSISNCNNWLTARPNVLGSIVVIFVCALGLFARIVGIQWDSFASLHPDERHLTFVVSGAISRFQAGHMHFIDVFRHWFDTGFSILDPRTNVPSFVYGDLPHILVTLESLMLSRTGWEQIIELGRTNSVIFDALTILVVSAGAYRLGGWSAAALGGLLYSAVPLALQQANFFTVDIPLTFCSSLFVLGLILLVQSTGWRPAILAGLALGLSFACKVSATALLPSILLALIVRLCREGGPGAKSLLAPGFGIFIIAVSTFRVANPSAFSGATFFDFAPSRVFLANFIELSKLSGPNPVPFLLQWKLPFVGIKSIRDLSLLALGPALLLSAAWGGWRAFAWPQTAAIRGAAMIICATAIVIIAQPLIYGEPLLRYFLPAAPLLAMLGGFGLSARCTPLHTIATAALCIFAIGWGAAMVEAHMTAHPRVMASKWILQKIPVGSQIASETDWDEGLPINVRLSPEAPARDAAALYHILVLNITTPDTPEKVERMINTIAEADLIVISSDRQYGPMMELSDRFPYTSRYYHHLFNGTLCLDLAARFVKPFMLFGLAVDDSWTQESWRVFDRPPVLLFKKAKCFDKRRLRQTLLD
jgi:hypothetical protein